MPFNEKEGLFGEEHEKYVLHLDTSLLNKQNFRNKEEIEKFILDKIYGITS